MKIIEKRLIMGVLWYVELLQKAFYSFFLKKLLFLSQKTLLKMSGSYSTALNIIAEKLK